MSLPLLKPLGGDQWGGEVSDRGVLVDESFFASICAVQVGLGGGLCGNPKAGCGIQSHMNASQQCIPVGSILSVSSRSTASRKVFQSAAFILPSSAGSLPEERRQEFLEQGDNHPRWRATARGGYLDLKREERATDVANESIITTAFKRLNSRIKTAERSLRSAGRTTQSGMASITTSTDLGAAILDGKRVRISLDLVTKTLSSVMSRVNSIENADPGARITFEQLSFRSYEDAIKYFVGQNPQGRGLAAWAGVTRSYAFSGSANNEDSTAQQLAVMAKAHAIGLTGNAEACYLAQCGRVLPPLMSGSTRTTLGVKSTLPVLESIDAYLGTGMGDGMKDRALNELRGNLADGRAYARSNLSGVLLDVALKCMQKVETFYGLTFGHIDNLIHQLSEAKMPEKQIMILCSRVLWMLAETVLPAHRAVSHANSSNKGLLAAAAAVATLQEVKILDEYIAAKIVDHPKINNCFIRFLTVQSVSANKHLSKEDIQTLVAKEADKLVKQIKAANDAAAAARMTVEKVSNKLNSVITRNDLKSGGK